MSSATRRTILKPIALGSATPERPPGGGGGGLPPHPSSGPPKFHPQQPHATAHDNMPLNTAPAHSDPSKLPHLNSNSQQQQNHSSHPHAAGQPAAAGISRDAVRSPVRPTDAPPSHPSPVRRLSFKSSQTEGHAAATNTTSATATVTTAAATHVGHDEASRLKTTTAAAGAHSHSGNKSNSQHAAHPPQQSGQAAAHHNQQAPSQHNAHARPQPGGPSSTSKGAVAVVTATAGGVNGKKSMQVPAGPPLSMADVVVVASRTVTSSLTAGLRNALMLVLGHPTYSPREQLAASEQVRRVALDLIHASISDAMSHVFAMLPAGPSSPKHTH